MSAAPLGVEGVRVGHWTGRGTGVTAVLAPTGTVGAAEVRGGAPATRETDVLDVTKTVVRVDAVVLGGGSAFGLRAADGVVDWLAEHGQGFPTAWGPVPIVAGAAIFDLVASAGEIPTAEDGRRAAQAAASGVSLATGRVGAGRGATVGTWRGLEHRVGGGLGVATANVGAVAVGALAVVNACGDVVGADGSVLAGSGGGPDGYAHARPFAASEREHTTLVVVATDAQLDKLGCRLVAESAHDGVARALRPAHTRGDGDVAFSLATGRVPVDAVDPLRMAAGDLVADAIRAAVA